MNACAQTQVRPEVGIRTPVLQLLASQAERIASGRLSIRETIITLGQACRGFALGSYQHIRA
jgi:hypothetical protein